MYVLCGVTSILELWERKKKKTEFLNEPNINEFL